MANLHQAAAACMKQTPIGNHPRANVMINHHLNHVACAARRAEQRFRHRPGADVMLNINRHAGVILQHFAERHVFYIVVKRHAMHNAILRINDSRHGDGDGGQTFQLLLVANKELIDMGNNAFKQGLL
ncbi:hypothetical protein D3C86_1353900 [compost metagenome]